MVGTDFIYSLTHLLIYLPAKRAFTHLPRLYTVGKSLDSMPDFRDRDRRQTLWPLVLAVMVPAGAAAEFAILDRVGALAVGTDALRLAGADQREDRALQRRRQ